MARSSNGRSYTGRANVPYIPRAPHIAAAKYLRLMADRYSRGEALLREVEEAMVMLRAAAPVAGDVGFREPAAKAGAR